jgi:tetratricopeptide (TPR) repeat protein
VDDAVTQYQKALEIKPNYAGAHYKLGNALIQKGQVDNAVAHYQKALQIDPNYAEAHDNLGNALLRKGQVDDAVAHYLKALEITPNSVETITTSARLSFKRDSWTQLERSFRRHYD